MCACACMCLTVTCHGVRFGMVLTDLVAYNIIIILFYRHVSYTMKKVMPHTDSTALYESPGEFCI